MNERLESMVELARRAGSGSRGVALLVGLALLLVLGAGGYVATRPELERLLEHLDDMQCAKVLRALSEAGIPFDVSSPPGPFVVYVEEGERPAALRAISLTGALEGERGGIVSDETGLATVFMSAHEREQAVRKREWEEAEAMLEGLDFVVRASVGTNASPRSPLRPSEPVTASVTLTLRHGRELDSSQARTVADLVRFRLGVEPENLVIADQHGNTLYDGAALSDPRTEAEDWLVVRQRHDADLEESANELLAMILGPGKARVKVNSAWNTDQTTTVSETIDPESRIVISEQTTNKKTPQVPAGAGGVAGGFGAAGGVAGTSSNLGPETGGFQGNGGAPAGAASPELVAKDDTSRREYAADRTTTQTVRLAPVLQRLTVSLFVDESVPAGQSAQLEESVKTAVGFDPARGDLFSTGTYTFAAEAGAEPEEGDGGAEESGGGMLETLLERGVEILSAVAFLYLVLRTLKSARRAGRQEEQPAGEAPSEGPPEEEAEEELPVDPVVQLRSDVGELARSDPERVAEVLTAWLQEERSPVGAGDSGGSGKT